MLNFSPHSSIWIPQWKLSRGCLQTVRWSFRRSSCFVLIIIMVNIPPHIHLCIVWRSRPERRPTDDQPSFFAADHVEDHPGHCGQQVVILLRIMRMGVRIKERVTGNQFEDPSGHRGEHFREQDYLTVFKVIGHLQSKLFTTLEWVGPKWGSHRCLLRPENSLKLWLKDWKKLIATTTFSGPPP